MNREPGIKKWYFLFLNLLLLFTPFYVRAQSVSLADIDLNQRGSLILEHESQEVSLAGSVFEIYQVASLTRQNGRIQYAMQPAFAGVDIDLQDLNHPRPVLAIQEWIDQKGIVADLQIEMGNQESVVVEPLPLGIYFVRLADSDASRIYMAPFLIAIPYQINGQIYYRVSASVKIATQAQEPQLPEDPENPDDPHTPMPISDEPDDPDNPDTPPDGPEKPDNPDAPSGDPDDPYDPDKPDPSDPNDPNTPVDPNDPDVPFDPQNPEDPNSPAPDTEQPFDSSANGPKTSAAVAQERLMWGCIFTGSLMIVLAGCSSLIRKLH